CEDITVRDNRCWGNNYDNGEDGLPLESGTAYAGVSFAAEVGTVSGNWCWENGVGFNLAFTGSPEDSSTDFTCSDNQAWDNAAEGFLVTANTAADKYVTFTNCIARGNGTATAAAGFRFSNVDRFTLVGGMSTGNSG